MQRRCLWVNEQNEFYCAYHDREWGTPIYDDGPMYELFLLELFQAGLSWITLLKKREAFRAAFDGFDVQKIASYDEGKVQSLLQDAGIIRCRGKIEAAIGNARAVMEIQREYGSFCTYLWSFSDGKIVCNSADNHRTTSPLSDRIAADLKRRGMRYTGSVTIYSFLQAAGIVNDHDKDCFRYKELIESAGPDHMRFEV